MDVRDFIQRNYTPYAGDASFLAGPTFAPGANPMHGRDRRGMAASALSVAKLPYEHAEDGISLTTTMIPPASVVAARSGSATSADCSTPTSPAAAST